MDTTIYTVVGLGRGESKKTGKKYFTLHVTSESDFVYGDVAENFFLGEKFAHDFDALQLGMKLEIYFNTVDGKRYIAKWIIKT